jgi:hypothetical protein
LPATFEPYSYGNLSNVFGQTATVGFLAWWLSGSVSTISGVLWLVVAGSSHLSALVVVAAGTLGLLVATRKDARFGTLRTTAVVGFAVVGLYYLRFAPLIAEQLPRLLEGGGQGTLEVAGAGGALYRQIAGLVSGLGAPVLVLAVLGVAKEVFRDWPRGLAGFGVGVAALVVPAVVSPLEVRYIYALAPWVALLAAGAGHWLWRRSAMGRAVVVLLAAAQAVLAARLIVDAVLTRYRV